MYLEHILYYNITGRLIGHRGALDNLEQGYMLLF